MKKQLKDIVVLKEKKKKKKQIMKGNEFRISWNRREGRTMRRQDSKASGGQVRTEQTCTESLQRQDRMVRGAETIQKWGQAEETVEL